MRRRLLNLLTALSLLLCAAVCALWVRSYWSAATFDWWSVGAGGYEFRVRGASARAGSVGFYVADYPPGLCRGSYPLHYHRYRTEGFLPPAHRKLGFAIERSSPAPGQADVSWRAWRVPCWFLLLAFAVAPARQTARAVSEARLRRRGLCPACAYDLRATPGRCPECGSTTSIPLVTKP